MVYIFLILRRFSFSNELVYYKIKNACIQFLGTLISGLLLLFELFLEGGLRMVLLLLSFGVGFLDLGQFLLEFLVLLLSCQNLLAVPLCSLLQVLREGGEFTVQIIWSLTREIIMMVNHLLVANWAKL